MMIAVATLAGQVAEHFGHCEAFLMYDSEKQTQEWLTNPGHKPGFLPNLLADKGVEAIVSGGMGDGAMEIFRERGVQVVTGAKGDALAAAVAFSQGKLVSSGEVCQHHHDPHEEA